MDISEKIVYVVDDDPAIRKALQRSLSKRDYQVQTFDSAEGFLQAYSPGGIECLVLDVRMPGISGLQLQERLVAEGHGLPIIFITAHGDIPMSVTAIKEGAVDFLEKPYPVDALMELIEQALDKSATEHAENEYRSAIKERFERLTSRERDVLSLLVAGAADTSNKQIARELDISHRTVDDHRSRIMAKMQARSLSELVEMAKICKVYRPCVVKAPSAEFA